MPPFEFQSIREIDKEMITHLYNTAVLERYSPGIEDYYKARGWDTSDQRANKTHCYDAVSVTYSSGCPSMTYSLNGLFLH